METKKSKVKTRELYKEDEYQGRKLYKFFVTFEGSDTKCVYTSSQQDPKYFKPGEEQEFEYELKKGVKDGKEWKMHIVSPVYPKKDSYGGGQKYQQLTIDDYALRQKFDSIGYSMSYASKLLENKAITKEDLTKLAEEMLVWQTAKIDKLLLTLKQEDK